MNLANLLEGPAVVFYKGLAIESKGGITANPSNSPFAIDTDRFGTIDNRSDVPAITVTLPPIGQWTAETLPVLFPWTNPRHGQLVNPIWDFESIELDDDEITVTAHGIRAGMPCRLGSFGELPGGLDDATLYYVGVVDADTINLHTTEADALAHANKVNITSAGTDEHHLIEQEPLIIHTERGRVITFHVGAVVDMPELVFSARETLMGAVQFECFRKNNTPWSTANSLFTVSKAPLNAPAPDKTKIPTQPYGLSWGGVAPWSNFTTRQAFRMKAALQLSEVGDDQHGLQSRKIEGVTVTGRGQPNGISEATLLDTLEMQGGTAARGKSRTSQHLTIAGTGVHARIYNSFVQAAPQNFSKSDPRAGELEWAAARGFSGGVLQPAFYVGTAAPAA